ncbi:MAG: hypothetical protein ACHQUA_00150 [Microgenomates group bacterium]
MEFQRGRKKFDPLAPKFAISETVFNHHYNYAYPGDQHEGIRQRVRQGIGGPTHMEPGADLIGHYHIGDESEINVGSQIAMQHEGKWWLVTVTQVSGGGKHGDGMISQKNEDETGYEIQGTCIKELPKAKNPAKKA